MRSFTSSSEGRFLAALVLTFGVLLAAWEGVLRRRGSASVDFAINSHLTASAEPGERWILFGNCLVMTGISPTLLEEQLGHGRERAIINIAAHEQSPIAFFEYLKSTSQYPDVIVANVSSWINSTNFEQEATLVTQADPLHVGTAARHESAAVQTEKTPQQAAETALSRWTSAHLSSLGHRYHLFDYSLFLGTLVSTANLDNALYQLNMQSWFRVTGSENDGRGFVGIRVAYRDDWSTGLERMADRSLQRLRLSRLLTDEYWTLLEQDVRDFRAHGTRIVLVRMPEHPRIRAFNDAAYGLSDRLHGIEERTGAATLDLSKMGLEDGVRLFDAVHPDADAAVVITREIGQRLRTKEVKATSLP